MTDSHYHKHNVINYYKIQFASNPTASYTKHFFPDIHPPQIADEHIPNLILTIFITSHGKFLQYLHKIS